MKISDFTIQALLRLAVVSAAFIAGPALAQNRPMAYRFVRANQKVLECENKIKAQLKNREIKFVAIGHPEFDRVIERANSLNQEAGLEREYQISTTPTHKVLKIALVNYRFVKKTNGAIYGSATGEAFENFSANISMSRETPKWPLAVELESNLIDGENGFVALSQSINFSRHCEAHPVETYLEHLKLNGAQLEVQNWEHASEKPSIGYQKSTGVLPSDRNFESPLLPVVGGQRVGEYYRKMIGKELVAYGTADLPLVNFRIETLEPVERQNPLSKSDEKMNALKIVWFDSKQTLSEYRILYSGATPYGERIQSNSVREMALDQNTWDERVLTGTAEGLSLVKLDSDRFENRAVLRAEMQTNQEMSYPNLAAYWLVESKEAANNPKREDLIFSYILKAQKKTSSRDSLPLSDRATKTPEFLRPSLYVEATHPKILALANGLLEDFDGTRIEMAQKISTLVNQLLTFDDDMVESNAIAALKASEILERGTGVCQHYAILYAALARAVGLPARVVSGYSLEPKQAFDHAWNEVEIADGVWLPIEPQYKNIFSIKSWNYMPLAVSAELDDPTRKDDLLREQWLLANFIFSIKSF